MSQTVLLLDICQYCKTKPELINFLLELNSTFSVPQLILSEIMTTLKKE